MPNFLTNPTESFSARLLRRLANSVYDHPRLFVYPQILLFVASILFTVFNLQFSTSRNELVGSEKKYHQNFLRLKQEFPGQDDLVAVVESEDPEKNRQFVERLGARLEAQTNLFADIIYRNDIKMLGPKALLFFPEEDLRELGRTLTEYRPFLQTFSQANNLEGLFQLVNHQFRTARRQASEANQSLVKALPALERIVQQAIDSLHREGSPPSPGITALFGAGEEAEQRSYNTFADGRIYVATARALREDVNPQAVARFRDLVGETQSEVPGVNVGTTGEPVLEIDEMAQSQADMTIATIVSLVIVALIFIYGYRETGRPIKATICLIVGLGYTLGFTTLVIGHLNLLTITFVPILIGLAIDFGVHLITRYEEELRHGQSERVALQKSMIYTGQGIFTGCFTTAGAFFAMALTDFKGIQEMGMISGSGMLICLVPMMTLLPVLLLRGRQNVLDHQLPQTIDTRARIEKLWMDRPRWVIAATLVSCLWAVTQMSKVNFDYNLLNMQSEGLPAVEFEKKLIYSADKSVIYGALVADSLPKAVAMESQATHLSSVASVDSMAKFLAEDQAEKLELIGQIKQQVASIEFATVSNAPVNLENLDQILFSLQGYLRLASDAVQGEGDRELLQQLQSLLGVIGQWRREINTALNPQIASAKLAAFQRALFKDIQQTFAAIKHQDNSSPLREKDLPPALRNRFVGRTGKHLLQVYPHKNVWQRKPQEEFVSQLRTIDPNVTGTPVQLYEYTSLLKESYEEAAWYALGAIILLILFHFRMLSALLLALLPVGIGSLWMLGIMGSLAIPFNPANIMTLPLVIGIGVTNGIHILNRFAEEQNPHILAKSTGKAVLISALTTIAGFGSLIFADHQGIASLGQVMSIGVGACMVAALTFLPALLHLLSRTGWQMKRTQ